MRIENYRNAHKGESVAILGNGPSLSNFDLSSLDTRLIGIHRTWRLIVPEYHVILQRREYWEEVRLRAWLPNIIFSANAYQPANIRKRGAYHPFNYHSNTVLINKIGPSYWGQFSLNLDRGTAAQNAGLLSLELAVFMGCNPIFLLGYDLNYGDGHFCDDFTPTDKMRDIQLRLFNMVAEQITEFRPTTKIYNANRESALTCWEYGVPN